FTQTLKEYFHMFEHGLYKELKDMKAVFNQMEIKDNLALESLKMENDRLMELLISQDLVHTHVNTLAAINDYKSMEQSFVDEYKENLKLQTELATKNEMVEKSEFFQINELQAQLEAKNVSIAKLKEHIANLKGKNVVDSVQTMHNSKVVTSKFYTVDLQPLSPCIKINRDARVDCFKHYVLNVNSELICATFNECMFDAIHDLCVRDYLNDVNARIKSKSVKSRSAKSKKKKIWKPTGKVYTNVGYSWKPTR
nr:hypothetical protein [Tanacetum cinerariifolium]